MLDWVEDLGLSTKQGVILLEEYAEDSLENLLFSMCRFFQFFGGFPASVSSCTWQFNVERFKIFAKRLYLPNFQVVAVGRKSDEEEIAQKWTKLAEDDPFYQKQQDSKEKYLKRDPWRRNHPYTMLNQDFLRLFAKLSEIKTKGGNPEEAKDLFLWKT